jgi:plasmid stability protein
MNKTEDMVKLVARLPASLHRKLQEQAKEHHRSLNSEMIEVLSAGLQADQILERLRVQDERIERLAGLYRTIEARREAERKNWAIGDLFDDEEPK